MKEISIDHPHGYLLDEEGQVIQRFGNWGTGVQHVHDATESVEYVDGPAAHDREVHSDYRTDPSQE